MKNGGITLFDASIFLTKDSTAVIKVIDYTPGKIVYKEKETALGVIKKPIKREGSILFIASTDIAFKRSNYDIEISNGKIITAKFNSIQVKYDSYGSRQVVSARTTPER